MSRSYCSIRPKGNRVYSASEVLELYGVGRNTVTNWTKVGLRTVDGHIPQLFRGSELARFHGDRALTKSRQLRAGEFKCLRCRLCVVPELGTLTIKPTRWAFIAQAICPECGSRVSLLLNATTRDAFREYQKTNTSLGSLHEEEGLTEACIGTSPPIPWPNWNPDNERAVRAYQLYCGKYSTQTQDAHLASIRDLEKHFDLKSFKKLKKEEAASYRQALARRGRTTSSRSTIRHRASQLAQFFRWLVQQDGYRHMNHSIAEYFELSRSDTASAIQPADRSTPDLATLEQVIAAMPSGRIVERRDRAIIAATCLFGTRANATASLMVGDVDIDRRQLRQDATRVRIKNSKSQRTAWFPVGEAIAVVMTDWIAEVQALGLRDNDALFPPDASLSSPRILSNANRKRIAPWQTEDAVRRAFLRGCEAAGVRYINPHGVRHMLAALGRDLCHSAEEELAWSHNLGHASPATTRNYYAKMTDDRRDDIFVSFGRRDTTPDDIKDSILRYLANELDPGTAEYELAQRAWMARLGKMRAP